MTRWIFFCRDERSNKIRIESIFDIKRYIFLQSRHKRRRINHFCAKMTHFHRFGIGHGRNREGLFHFSRIGSQHAIHICPYFYHFCIESCGNNCCCIIRATAPKSCGQTEVRIFSAAFRRAYKSSYNLHFISMLSVIIGN